jgi:hypothetical protein
VGGDGGGGRVGVAAAEEGRHGDERASTGFARVWVSLSSPFLCNKQLLVALAHFTHAKLNFEGHVTTD